MNGSSCDMNMTNAGVHDIKGSIEGSIRIYIHTKGSIASRWTMG